MVEDILIEKYGEYLIGLDIYENRTSLKLSRIVIKPDFRDKGIGSKIMKDLVKYADQNKQLIVLTPSSDFGGNKNRLIQFYKQFGLKHNKGQYKNFEFRDSMIRYPHINETIKPVIKRLLRGGLNDIITCAKCGWSWKASESEQDDLYVCHKCGYDNKEKNGENITKSISMNNKNYMKSISQFVNFAKDFLGITDDVGVKLAFERTPELKTTAYYSLDGFLVVYAKDRLLVDIEKSIAHELTHHLQNIEGRLIDPIKDGEDGSPIENEANAKAGEIIRKWGRLHPEIYYKTGKTS